MKRQLFIAVFLVLAMFVEAQTVDKNVKSQIKEVTVFLQGAQIIRKLNTSVNQGKTILRLSGLSPNIDAKSIQLKANSNCKIISVNYNKNFIDQLETSEEVNRINSRIEAMELLIENMENDIAILKEKEQFLKSNTDITGKNQTVNPTDYKELTSFYYDQIKEIKNGLFIKSRAIKKNEKELTALKTQKKEIMGNEKVHSSEILITVLSTKTLRANLELSYYVGNAHWYPSYDIRVNEIGKPLKMAFKANIKQSSGIDWTNVNLKLSNANPNIGNSFEGLETSYVSFYKPGMSVLQGKINGVNINNGHTGSGGKITIRGQSSINQSADPLYVVDGVVMNRASTISPEDIESLSVLKGASATTIYGARAGNGVVLISTKKGGFIDKKKTKEIEIAYKINSPLTVLSGKPVSTFEVKSMDVKANYIYRCAPGNNTGVFATAKISDWEDLNLLDGETNLFYQQTYVGQSTINTKTVSDTLSFDLGREKNIIVKRKEQADYNRNRIVSNKKVVSKSYEIEIRNNKNKSVKIEIFEQVPLSTDKQIQVEVLKISNAAYNDKSGILKWTIELAPGESKKMDVKYEVKFPKESIISIN